jgi:Ca-activated chloride channel family protein
LVYHAGFVTLICSQVSRPALSEDSGLNRREDKAMRNVRWLVLCALVAALLVLPAGCGDSPTGGTGGGDDDDGYHGDDDGYADDDYSDDDDDDNNGGYDDDSGGYDDDMDDDNDDNDDADDDDNNDDSSPEPECPDTTDPQVLYLSADDSNSQGSPVIARAIIHQGDIVPRGKVRTYEFTNYYQIDYEPAPQGRVRVVPQLRPLDDGKEDPLRYVFQIGVQSHELEHECGRNLNLTFSLDTSGSMEGMSFHLLQKTMRTIAGRLREGDIVSIVEWDDTINVPLDSHLIDGPNDEALLDAIDALHVDGSTNLHAGLVRAYELAQENYNPNRMNRVVLISDAQANTGIVDLEIIAAAADDSEAEGIYLVGVGVGEPHYYFNDLLMDEVTDAGKGAYVFIDTDAEADKQFGDRFQENLEIAAMEVQVRLEMPYYLILEEYHGEEYSGDPTEVDPQHLAPNDAMVFNQYLVACDNSLVNPNDVLNVAADYLDPFTRQAKHDETTLSIAAMLAANADQLLKGDAIVVYAEALKEIDRLLSQNKPDEALAVCRHALQRAAQAATQLGDNELWEIVDLLEIYESTVEYASDW